MSDKYALDTNILIYLHEQRPNKKRTISEGLAAGNPVISPQVISEYLNVCHKKLKMGKLDALESLNSWLPFCTLADFSAKIYNDSAQMIERHQFQLFDSIVVAYALASGCNRLYSEDMQHNLLVKDQLLIINPFL